MSPEQKVQRAVVAITLILTAIVGIFVVRYFWDAAKDRPPPPPPVRFPAHPPSLASLPPCKHKPGAPQLISEVGDMCFHIGDGAWIEVVPKVGVIRDSHVVAIDRPVKVTTKNEHFTVMEIIWVPVGHTACFKVGLYTYVVEAPGGAAFRIRNFPFDGKPIERPYPCATSDMRPPDLLSTVPPCTYAPLPNESFNTGGDHCFTLSPNGVLKALVNAGPHGIRRIEVFAVDKPMRVVSSLGTSDRAYYNVPAGGSPCFIDEWSHYRIEAPEGGTVRLRHFTDQMYNPAHFLPCTIKGNLLRR